MALVPIGLGVWFHRFVWVHAAPAKNLNAALAAASPMPASPTAQLTLKAVESPAAVV
jgi:hypothetical protein